MVKWKLLQNHHIRSAIDWTVTVLSKGKVSFVLFHLSYACCAAA